MSLMKQSHVNFFGKIFYLFRIVDDVKLVYVRLNIQFIKKLHILISLDFLMI